MQLVEDLNLGVATRRSFEELEAPTGAEQVGWCFGHEKTDMCR
jgi:hypothetical protein